MRLILALLVALMAAPALAAPVVTSYTATVQIVFYIEDGTNSPYQGLLTYDLATYQSKTLAQLKADGLAQYQTWLTATAAAQAADIANANAVPSSVSSVQLRKAIIGAGIKTQVEAAIAAGDAATQTYWYTADYFNRSDALVATLGTALGYTSQQLDNLFIAAGKL